MTEEGGLGIRLGTHRAPALGEVSVGLDEANHGTLGTVRVSAAALAGAPADYRAEARLEAGSSNLTRGWVARAEVDADEVALEVRNSLPLSEQVIGHLAMANLTGEEVAWSIAQWAGFTPAVPGLRPVREVIAVAMPVEGLDLTDDLHLGPVRLTRDRELIEIMVKPLETSDATADFLEVGVWAVARVEASVLFGAERGAVPLIEAAIDRLALEIQYSLATDPDGAAIPFSRAALFADPIAMRTVLAHGHATGRTWLRSLDNPRVRESVQARRVVLLTAPEDPSWNDALRAWRRAVRETDRLAAVGALFEAIEFYASRTKVAKILGDGDLARFRAAIEALTLDPTQRQRLADVLARANEPPLRVRSVAALEADGVPWFQDDEIARLWRLREHRNDALHGRRRGEPDADDLDLAKGFMNRMLAFRASRTGRNGADRDRNPASESGGWASGTS